MRIPHARRAETISTTMALVCLACGPAREVDAMRDPQVLFTSYLDGNGELFVLSPGDSTPTNLTQNAAYDGFGKFSPDGMRIVFDSDRAGDSNRDIYVMDRDGSNVRRVTEHPNFDLLPTWSPDGLRIAFMSLRDGDWRPDNRGVPFVASIYVMNADGSELRRLTDAGVHDQSPTWSPDGNTIVFSRHVGDLGQLFAVGVDGTNLRQIRISDTYDAAPAFSPDGRQIAFYALQADTAHIWIVNLDGTDAYQVTKNFRENYEPSWSPDGRLICYTVGIEEQWDIYATDLSAGIEYPLVTSPARDQACAWTAGADS